MTPPPEHRVSAEGRLELDVQEPENRRSSLGSGRVSVISLRPSGWRTVRSIRRREPAQRGLLRPERYVRRPTPRKEARTEGRVRDGPLCKRCLLRSTRDRAARGRSAAHDEQPPWRLLLPTKLPATRAAAVGRGHGTPKSRRRSSMPQRAPELFEMPAVRSERRGNYGARLRRTLVKPAAARWRRQT